VAVGNPSQFGAMTLLAALMGGSLPAYPQSPTIAEVETFLSHIVSAHRLRGPLNACQRQMG